MAACDPAMSVNFFCHAGLRPVQMMIGAFDSVVDADAQDAMLHSIFSTLAYYHHMALGAGGEQHLSKPELRCVLMTLFRLFCKEKWEAARTFFHIFTGKLLTDYMVEKLEEEKDVLTVMDGTLALNPVTIVGDCDREDIPLNNLWFDSADDDDDDSDASSRSSGSRSEDSETRTDIEEYVAEVERRMAATSIGAKTADEAADASTPPTTRRRRRRDDENV